LLQRRDSALAGSPTISNDATINAPLHALDFMQAC